MKKKDLKKITKDQAIKDLDKLKKDLFNFRFQKMSASAFGSDFDVKNAIQKTLRRRSGRLKRPSRALQSLQKVPNGVPNGAKIDLQAKWPLQDPPDSDLGVPTAPFWNLWGAILNNFRTIFTSRFSKKKTTTNMPD